MYRGNMVVTVTINDHQYSSSSSSGGGSGAKTQTTLESVNLGETVSFRIDTPTRLVKACIQNASSNALQTFHQSLFSFEVKQVGSYFLVIELDDDDLPATTFQFTAIIPFGLLTNEMQLSADGGAVYKVQLRNVSPGSLFADNLVFHPSEMFAVAGLDGDWQQAEPCELPIKMDLGPGDSWTGAFMLHHRLSRQDDGSVRVCKSDTLGTLEIKWENRVSGERPGRLQTGPLRRKDMEAVAVWLEPTTMPLDEETAVRVFIQNNTDQPIFSAQLLMNIDTSLICWTPVLPVGPIACRIAELAPGERASTVLRMMCMQPGRHDVDSFMLSYTLNDGVQHCHPQEFTITTTTCE